MQTRMPTAHTLRGFAVRIPDEHGLLSSKNKSLMVLESIRTEIGMAPLEDCGEAILPIAAYANGDGKAWGPGVSIIVPLQDSHMCIHCLSHHRMAFFELVSCKPFDAHVVQRLLEKHYGGIWDLRYGTVPDW